MKVKAWVVYSKRNKVIAVFTQKSLAKWFCKPEDGESFQREIVEVSRTATGKIVIKGTGKPK